MSGASVSLFSVTFCRQIIPNSVFLSATEDKIKQQHHLFVLARSSFKRDAKHGETQKGRTPRRAISAKTERTHDAPGLLKARPQFYLLPCYFCIRARFFFFFCLKKNVLLPLCSQTALNSTWQGDATAGGLRGENQLTTPKENEAESSGKIWNGRENQTTWPDANSSPTASCRWPAWTKSNFQVLKNDPSIK